MNIERYILSNYSIKDFKIIIKDFDNLIELFDFFEIETIKDNINQFNQLLLDLNLKLNLNPLISEILNEFINLLYNIPKLIIEKYENIFNEMSLFYESDIEMKALQKEFIKVLLKDKV